MTPPTTRGKPRLLDLFCGAGGAAMGYSRAGFDVVGVDIKPQPRYPFEFHQGDALAYPLDGFDAIHASPPCQAFTALKTMPNAKAHADLVGVTRTKLLAAGVPFVIENVVGAPMEAPTMLCGTMFDLGTGEAELRRHRYFDTHGFFVLTPECCHRSRRMTVGVYGDGNGRDYRRHPVTVGVWGSAGGSSKRDGIQQFSTAERCEAMGIDWMTGDQLSQAIPPAYTEFIGRALLAAVEARR